MFATAMNLLEVHPIFRYVTLTPPRFARKWIKNTTTANRLFAPAFLGVLTVLIPCGVTQAMEVIAVSSGNPIQGALILGSFVLGTVPAFSLIGLATAKLSETWRTYFLRAAAILLIGMSLYSMNGILLSLDSPYSAQRIWAVMNTPVGAKSIPIELVDGAQPVTIQIQNSGYVPQRFTVKAGTPVKLTLKSGDVYSCAASFTFRAFNIRAYIKPNTEQEFTFTPKERGQYTYSCSMGMYSGVMEVI
jgi:heme/copper-type cytochrome/quinol oxidase subunit 2